MARATQLPGLVHFLARHIRGNVAAQSHPRKFPILHEKGHLFHLTNFARQHSTHRSKSTLLRCSQDRHPCTLGVVFFILLIASSSSTSVESRWCARLYFHEPLYLTLPPGGDVCITTASLGALSPVCASSEREGGKGVG